MLCTLLRRPSASFLAALALAACAAASGSAQATTDSLTSNETPSGTVRAADPRVALSSARQLVTSSFQLERAIGARPGKITVFVLDRDAPAYRAEIQGRVTAGDRVLVWLGRTSKVRLAAAVAGSPAPESQRTLDDPEAAFQHALGHALVEAWTDAIRRPPGAPPGDAIAPLEGPAANAAVSAAPPAGSYALDLEAPHRGDDPLPDWFEEGLAVMCEPASSQKRRLDWMREHGASHLAFKTFLARRGGPSAGSDAFVCQSYSLLKFLVEQEGAPFLTRLASGMVRGRSFEESLTHATGVLSKPEALEKQWLSWLEDPAVKFGPPRARTIGSQE